MSKRKTPRPLRLVEAQAIACAMEDADQEGISGSYELQVRHDDWCLSQRPPGTWCNCDPDYRLVPFPEDEKLAAERLAEVETMEMRRMGLLRHEEN